MAELEKTPANLDAYVSRLFAPEDAALSSALAAMEQNEIPSIQVSASEGKLLHLLAKMIAAERILEIGTLGGYSTIWLARALPSHGKLISLELEPHHAETARANIARAGLADRVEIRIGIALESMAILAAEKGPPFDLIFIDADKDNYPQYLEMAAPLTRIGGLILGDNALTHSALDPDADTGITRYNAAVARRPDLLSIIVPTLREEIDGLLISLKIA